MTLEETADCDATCSGLDAIGCEIISHEECEKRFEEALKPTLAERYVGVGNYLRDNHPTTYKVLRFFGF
ncbi:Uncharacterised protein [uncultured archaeon]|nr:Uncharacterised protein [uncultured archaeon]